MKHHRMVFLKRLFIAIVFGILMINIGEGQTRQNVTFSIKNLQKKRISQERPNDYEAISSKVKIDKRAKLFLITSFQWTDEDGSFEDEDLEDRISSEHSDYAFDHKQRPIGFSKFIISTPYTFINSGAYKAHLFKLYQPPQYLLA